MSRILPTESRSSPPDKRTESNFLVFFIIFSSFCSFSGTQKRACLPIAYIKYEHKKIISYITLNMNEKPLNLKAKIAIKIYDFLLNLLIVYFMIIMTII